LGFSRVYYLVTASSPFNCKGSGPYTGITPGIIAGSCLRKKGLASGKKNGTRLFLGLLKPGAGLFS